MSKLFQQLVSENLIIEWAETLDWMFDDLKFSKERNWNSGYTSLFTKRVKQLTGINKSSDRFIYGKINPSTFPNQANGGRREQSTYIMIAKGDSFARDFIRHIRNGIAHGQTQVYKVQEELYIEIIDYSDKSKSLFKQTAFICIPLSHVTNFYKIYSNINVSIMNTKKKDRMQRKVKEKNNGTV